MNELIQEHGTLATVLADGGHTSDTAAALAAVERLEKVHQLTIEDPRTFRKIPIALAAKGFDFLDLEATFSPYRDAPVRTKGTAKLTTLPAFIAHANRFKGESSALFADDNRTAPKLVSVIDYHGKGAPRFGEHRGCYEFPLSDEWKAWHAATARPFDQAAFAEFIEKRLLDVLDPNVAGQGAVDMAKTCGMVFATPAKLLEMSRGLSIRVGSKVANAVNLNTGEVQLQYETTHTDDGGSPLKIPNALLLGIPVFRAGTAYQVPVRLRHRVSGGSVTWSVELHNTDRIFDDAFCEAAERAQTETGLPLFMGSPE